MWTHLSLKGFQFNLLWTSFRRECWDNGSSLPRCFTNRNHDTGKRGDTGSPASTYSAQELPKCRTDISGRRWLTPHICLSAVGYVWVTIPNVLWADSGDHCSKGKHGNGVRNPLLGAVQPSWGFCLLKKDEEYRTELLAVAGSELLDEEAATASTSPIKC